LRTAKFDLSQNLINLRETEEYPPHGQAARGIYWKVFSEKSRREMRQRRINKAEEIRGKPAEETVSIDPVL
jgi:hypothetical protein